MKWIVVVVLALAQLAGGATEKPNIVFILADDLGEDDLDYERGVHRTPHLDKLAREGCRFSRAYCAQPICSPTRAALMTGKTPARLHLTTYLPGRADAPSQLLLHPKIEQQLPLEEKTIAEHLREAGYATACIGKWHLGGRGFGPAKQGFDVVFEGEANTEPSKEEGGKGEYGLTARAEQFMTENKGRPFFLYLAHNSPHIPLRAKPELIATHQGAFNPVYEAMIETLDASVGRLLARIEELNLRDNTMVVFTSDNGGLHVLESVNTPATVNGEHRAGKGYLYEGGLRIPLLVRWPGKVNPGSVYPDRVISTDWMPTLLEAAGLPVPVGLDGVSLVPLLSLGTDLPERMLYWHFPHYTNQGGRPGGAIRDGDWKLIEHYENGRTELFNIAEDVSENRDRGNEEPKRVAELRGKLEAWRRSVDAQENTINPRFDPVLARKLYQDIDTSRLPPAATAAELARKLQPWRGGLNAALKPGAWNAAVAPVILLKCKDAQIHGETLRYEPQPEKQTIGFWTRQEEWVSWEFDLEKPAEFEVEILQGCTTGGSEVEVSVGAQTLKMVIQGTGHFQRFVPRNIGAAKLAAGKHTLTVKPTKKAGAAIMDLRSITLKPTVP